MNEILTLQPDVISRLSQGHDATVTGLQAATAAPAGISANVATTHGTFTSEFNNALSEFEAVRARADQALQGVATGLSKNLNKALTAYVNTDRAGAEILDQQVDR
ncbi:ESX-1 secretion-associated EspF-like protein [Mycobacterium liflandii 128FXT]|uniref:ESX-1 secretion-associated EspF-like protein n=1 Tax=Mycobacterium liflandii (strain 128FXT) TaxID=459424 RepID=L7VC19_MYCL1|nr:MULTISPECIES: ESX-1 secretion-associated protein [Mycobacterium ulcerans group]AGC64095.1 ESX-1 secretion-associated EspF-like protein [Mycobacterium liflandii 128FXT]RFZ63135.1 ESX-1 secretion-associated protein EspF [Mycobacterium marinum]ULL11941.1 ESX-1 secretion-associated protein [Mycobacterium liflandii]